MTGESFDKFYEASCPPEKKYLEYFQKFSKDLLIRKDLGRLHKTLTKNAFLHSLHSTSVLVQFLKGIRKGADLVKEELPIWRPPCGIGEIRFFQREFSGFFLKK